MSNDFWCRKCKDFTMIVTSMQPERIVLWCPKCMAQDVYVPDEEMLK